MIFASGPEQRVSDGESLQSLAGPSHAALSWAGDIEAPEDAGSQR